MFVAPLSCFILSIVWIMLSFLEERLISTFELDENWTTPTMEFAAETSNWETSWEPNCCIRENSEGFIEVDPSNINTKSMGLEHCLVWARTRNALWGKCKVSTPIARTKAMSAIMKNSQTYEHAVINMSREQKKKRFLFFHFFLLL